MPYDSSSPVQKKLIQWVEFRVDSLTAAGQTPAVNPESIYLELEEAEKTVLRKAPSDLVMMAGKEGATVLNSGKQVMGTRLILPVPEDFIRFLSIQCASWNIPVFDLLDARSNQYRLQLNPNSTAHAGAPLAALIPHPGSVGKRAIEVFPADTASSSPVSSFAYVGPSGPEMANAELKDAIVWEATFRVLMNTRDWEAAAAASKGAEAAISGLFVGKKGEEVPTK